METTYTLKRFDQLEQGDVIYWSACIGDRAYVVRGYDRETLNADGSVEIAYQVNTTGLEPGGLKDKRVTLTWCPSSPVNIVAAQ